MIVAFTIPAMGHVKPMMPLLSGLVERGQRVACFGHRKFEAIIRATGADFSLYPEIAYDIDAPNFNLVQMAADLINASQSMHGQLMSDIASMKPQLIVQDFMALWASRIGTNLGIPRVHTIPTLVFNSETERRMRKEDGLAKLARDALRGSPSLIRAMIRSKFAVSVREAFGLERSWRTLTAPVCEVVFSLESLQPGNPHGDVRRHYIGPTMKRPEHDDAAASRGCALITFGTLSNNETGRFEAAMRGAFLAGYSVVVQCGAKVDRQHLERVARALEAEHPRQTVTIIESVADMETVIVGADIVIHHAGMATTWEAVRHRKPALFIPTIADQKVLASQLERDGFGVRLPRGREYDAQAIARGLEDVRSRDYPWSKIHRLLMQAGGAAAGVQVILDALEATR